MSKDNTQSFLTVTGNLVYARSTQRVATQLIFPKDWELTHPLRCVIGKASYQVKIASISPPEGRAPRIITLDNGNKIFIAASDMPAFLTQTNWAGRIDRAERAALPFLIMLCVLITGALGALGYWALPKLSNIVADHIPEPVIEEISHATITHLDQFIMDESRLSNARQAVVQENFDKLRLLSGLSPDITLLFRSSALMGPNALALPGGPIIVLDELIEIAPSDEGIYGVLAHELAHIALRHNRQRLARDSLFSLIAIMIGSTQDLSQGTALIKSLIFSDYSRQFEEEADLLARQWVAQAGYDENAFDEMLKALYRHDCEDHCPASDEEMPSGWFDSHPSLSERLSR